MLEMDPAAGEGKQHNGGRDHAGRGFAFRFSIVFYMAAPPGLDDAFESSAKRMRAPRAFTRSCVGLASNQRVVPRRPGAVRRARRRAGLESKLICPDVGTTFRLSDPWALLVDLPLRGTPRP